MFFEIIKSKKNLKDIILILLRRHPSLSIRKIHSLIKSNYNFDFSYQAVHKAIRQLEENGVLEKYEKEYRISKTWLKYLKSFLEGFEQRDLNIQGDVELRFEGDIQTITFDSLNDLELYRKSLQESYLSEKKKNKKPYCSRSYHLKSPIVYSEKSIKSLQHIKNTNTQCYLLVKGDSAIDNWCAEYYRNRLVKIVTGANVLDDYELYVMGDIVMQVYLPEELKKEFSLLYDEIRNINRLKIPKFYRDLYQKQVKIRVVMYKNKGLAEGFRKEIINEFKKRVCLFDLDGTLTKGVQIYEFSKYMLSKGKIENKEFAVIEKLMKKYNDGDLEYRDFADKLIKAYAKSLKGQKVVLIKKHVRSYLSSSKFELLPYTKDLIDMMKNLGSTIIISGSPSHLVEGIKSRYKLDRFYATKFDAKNGRFTGKVKLNLALSENKSKILNEIDFLIDKENSFGFGDSLEDLPLLEVVSKRFFLNPLKEAREAASGKEICFLDSAKEDVIKGIKLSLN